MTGIAANTRVTRACSRSRSSFDRSQYQSLCVPVWRGDQSVTAFHEGIKNDGPGLGKEQDQWSGDGVPLEVSSGDGRLTGRRDTAKGSELISRLLIAKGDHRI